jgi:amino acid transporter
MQTLSVQKISTVALVLLIAGAIDSIRNLPAAALFGSSLIFFFIFSALVFLIPVALVSAELSSTWADAEGGIYGWVKNAFGEKIAFFTIWLQWINTMVWYPSILSFIAGTLAYLIDPNLAQDKIYLVSIILATFWGLTFLALFGLHTSAMFASFCAIVGMIIPMILIVSLAVIWIIQGQPTQIELSFKNLIPEWKNMNSWVSLTAIMTSFLGMELAAVHVNHVENPQKNYPRAMLFSTLLILSTMILGSLAIAFVLPANKINLVDGVMEAFSNFLHAYHLSYLMPIIVIMLLIGSLGSMVNWIISPAKGLLMAADSGFLPEWLHRRNENDVAANILLVQAVLVTLLCSGFLLLPSVNEIYWLFTDLSTELYIGMYVLMFLAAIRLKTKFASKKRPFAIPGGKQGYHFVCGLGLFGCIITLIIGFIPPQQTMDFGGAHHFRMVFSVGLIILVAPVSLFYYYKRVHDKRK